MSEITGTTAADLIEGTPLADTVRTLGGADQIRTLNGDDVVYLPDGDAQSSWGASIDGGEGNDTLDASGTTANLRIVASGTPDFGIPVTAVNSMEHIIGGGGNDAIVMIFSQQGVTIDAGAGNDILAGGAGDDLLNGGSGTDVSVFLDMYRGTDIALTGGDGTISTASGGTDTLKSVEYTIFKDGTLTADPDSQAAQVVRLFQGLFARAPSALELDNAAHQLSHGTSLAGLINGLISSEDSLGIKSSSTNETFVDTLYSGVLGRGADAGGKAYWLDALASGVTREQIVTGFTESAEFRSSTADHVGRGIFVTDEASQYVASLFKAMSGHMPDQAGFDDWSAKLRLGALTSDQVAAGLADSKGWHTHTDALNNAELVDYMYKIGLGREADSGGRAYWIANLDAGMTDGQLIQGFAASAEMQALVAPDIHGGIAVQSDYFFG